MRTKSSLELAEAEAMAAGCRRTAKRLGARVAIAVVDDSGALIHFQRLDGARAHTVDLAIRKAKTASMLGVPTRALELLAKQGSLQSGEALALAGGVSVIVDGDCAGAIGVSGAATDIDDEIANAGLAAFSAVEHPRSSGA
ncbi:GlcG/HbpS family heme-binding protein [Phenylobacterium montanum]|uniref:Heme-binding protein n=1 Tax=Phenylobacterium montanum TaxID=2823693 RepID=A0A975IWU8_9CAUL|nr:heme-binding protein [Caulobacter sp. S6]QUD90273.1 heme-binding protein [Caulobacter sp. S6]